MNLLNLFNFNLKFKKIINRLPCILVMSTSYNTFTVAFKKYLTALSSSDIYD